MLSKEGTDLDHYREEQEAAQDATHRLQNSVLITKDGGVGTCRDRNNFKIYLRGTK